MWPHFFALADAKENDVSTIWAIDVNAVKADAVELLIENNTIERPENGDFSFSDREVFRQVILSRGDTPIVAPVQTSAAERGE